MPVSLTISVAPVVLFRMMPPSGPGRSLIARVFWPSVCRTMLGETGSPAIASGGMPARPKRQPDQIGKFGSPCSNSTQTPDPIGGTM